METHERSQARRSHGWERRSGVGGDLIVPNPKLKLLDQVREVMRLKHYSIRTERCYCDWIKRFIKFHGMRSREDLNGAEPKIEQFLSDLAVNGHVAASTQNQALNGHRDTTNIERPTSNAEPRTKEIRAGHES